MTCISKTAAKAQAKLLSDDLAGRGLILTHSDVLTLIAKLQGFPRWRDFEVAAQKAELSLFARMKAKLKALLSRF